MGFVTFLIVLSILVFIHELGHFSVARYLGVKVYVFSIGFGKKLITKQYKGTQWSLSLIPLGGYVKMKGQEDLNPALANNDQKINMRPKGEKTDPVLEFGKVLGSALGEVNDLDKESGRQLELLAAGKSENVHEVMMAVQKSKIAMDFTIAIRNKAVEAYKEIMRMQM